jgi:uncharacterized glyoxalase superfamily protein PhnB
MASPRFLRSQVVIPVTDIYDTLAWYERVLGFETRYVHGSGRRDEVEDVEDFANYAIMGRDTAEVHFIMDEGGPAWTRSGTGYIYLRVLDVDTAYADIKSKGIAITRQLQHENWPVRGFNLRDPSGNEVHIEQPLEPPVSDPQFS